MAPCVQDGGDPSVQVSPRDIVYTLSMHDTGSNGTTQPQVMATTDLRSGLPCNRACLNCLTDSKHDSTYMIHSCSSGLSASASIYCVTTGK